MKRFTTFLSVILEKKVTEIIFGVPSDRHEYIMGKPHGLLPVDASRPLLPPPPSNDSPATLDELKTLQERLTTSESNTEMLSKWDVDLLVPFVKYLKEHDLSYNKRTLDKIINASTVVLLKQKYLFNRPRPKTLAKALGVDLSPLPAKTADSPAYPSGHSTQSRLIALYLSGLHRKHSKGFLDLAEECGQSRLNAGVHYPSDHRGGKELANLLYASLPLNELNQIKYRDAPASVGGREGY